MRIGLIDVDGHNFPNLAQMRLSTYHKRLGDLVERWKPEEHYDLVYMSKVFSDTYTKDLPDPENADAVYRGGTGYAIKTINGVEVFDADKHEDLPDDMESMPPDYSLYPDFKDAIAMTTRGCPRMCNFCIVGCKEGLESRRVADVSDFYRGQERIQILDPNILACPDRVKLLEDYKKTGAICIFNQGLDVRLMDDEVIKIIDTMRMPKINHRHFAWDNPNEDLRGDFERVAKGLHWKQKGVTYVLTNFGSTLEQDLYRIYTLRELGYDPFVMIYDKANAPTVTKKLARWVNNPFIFRKVERFEDYDVSMRGERYKQSKER